MSEPSKTKGQVEAEISKAMIQFEKEYMGRGPEETRTYIIEDMVLVRHRGVLTPAEQQLAKSNDPAGGRLLIKRIRTELREQARPLLAAVVESITGGKVISLHTDVSTVTGERIIVFTLAAPLEF
jgi:uncharacterized protein YbcI